MQLHERHRTATPEGVHLDAEIAGIGSRALAACVDLLLINLALGVITALSIALLSVTSFRLAGALLPLAPLVAIIGYSTLFETIWDGRTPGKRLLKLQVIKLDGAPIDIGTAFLRSLIRVIEVVATIGIVPIVMVFADRKHQRLGDLVAGTAVVRERQSFAPTSVLTTAAYDANAPFRNWDVYAISPKELATTRRFLDRRSTLRPAARRQLGIALWSTLKPKVAGAPEDWNPEAFLESIVAARTVQGLG